MAIIICRGDGLQRTLLSSCYVTVRHALTGAHTACHFSARGADANRGWCGQGPRGNRVGKANKNSPFEKKHNDVLHVFGYGERLDPAVAEEAARVLGIAAGSPTGQGEWMLPQLTLALADQAVRYIERNYNQSALYGGAKFAKAPYPDEIRWGKAPLEPVIDRNPTAFDIYRKLRGFYYLLSIPEYWVGQYCVSIEAAREALVAVCPNGFPELPPKERFGSADLETAKILTEQCWPKAEHFNAILDKIAEIVSAGGYRSKIAREKTKLKQRANSVRDLINGLLGHHKSLTVVATRLSIRQGDPLDRIDVVMKSAFARLIGDRRNDALLSKAIGYFWVLQESFKTTFRKPLPRADIDNPVGRITLHYDLVIFFDAGRSREVKAIGRHIGACWKVLAGEGAFYRALNGESFYPYEKIGEGWKVEKAGLFPSEYEFTGLVNEQGLAARNLRRAALSMVYSAALRKPSKQSPTLFKSTMRRFGKSDLLTARGLDKPGRGNQRGPSAVKRERKKRPQYAPPENLR